MATKSAKEQRLYCQVVDKIMQLIESREYPIGSRLPAERELAERFKVSRPTIREAIIALEAKGHVMVKIGSGVYVSNSGLDLNKYNASLSPFELIEARVLIEGEMAALAATMITDKQLIELEAALKAMAEEKSFDDGSANNSDRKFHEIISQATHNSVLPTITEELWDAQEQLEHIKLAHDSVCAKDSQRRIDEHTAIYEALAERNPNDARVAMRNHFTRLLSALHEASEQQAVLEVQQKVSQNRNRFSMERLITV